MSIWSGWERKHLLAALGIAAFSGAIAVVAVPLALGHLRESIRNAQPTYEQDLAEFRRGLEEADRHGVWALTRRIFPEEVAGFEHEIVTDYRARRLADQDVRARSEAFLDELVAANIHHVRQSDTAAASSLFVAQLGAVEVLERRSALACAEYGEFGSVSTPSEALRTAEVEFALGSVARSNLVAIESGREQPQEPSTLSPHELQSIRDDFVLVGGDRRWLAALDAGATRELAPQLRCRSVVLFMQVVNARDDFKARYLRGTLQPPAEPMVVG